MRRMGVLLIMVTAFSLTSGGAASGGGWWSSVGLVGSDLGIGEKLKVRTEVWFRTMETAARARNTPYYAYLVRGADYAALDRAMSRPQPRRWWEPPEESIPVGEVELTRWDSNIAQATANITIPDLAPGRYSLMLCDGGCTTPLANIIPQRVRVTPETLAAETARKLVRADARSRVAVSRLRYDLRATRRQLARAKSAAAEATEDVARLQERVSSQSPSTSPQTERSVTPWWAFAGWFFGGATLAFAATPLLTRRRRPARAPEEVGVVGVVRVPDDARELTARR